MDINEAKKILNTFLTKQKLRKTAQRDAVTEIIFAQQEPFTIDDIVKIAQNKQHNASRATVYRTIQLLEKTKLIKALNLGEEVNLYSSCVQNQPQNNLVCIDCGKIIHFDDSHIELLNGCITNRLGFTPVTQTVNIRANCQQLRHHGSCSNLIQARLQKKIIHLKKSSL